MVESLGIYTHLHLRTVQILKEVRTYITTVGQGPKYHFLKEQSEIEGLSVYLNEGAV